jgi:hypothetical protein
LNLFQSLMCALPGMLCFVACCDECVFLTRASGEVLHEGVLPWSEFLLTRFLCCHDSLRVSLLARFGRDHIRLAVANTPAGQMEFIRSYDSIRFGLPSTRGGSAPASLFSGPARRSLTLRPARSPSRLATLCTKGFSSLVASTAALIATGWSEPVPGRVYPRCGPPPFHGAPEYATIRPLTFRSGFASVSRYELGTATARASAVQWETGPFRFMGSHTG